QLYANLRGAQAHALDPAEVLASFLRELGVDSAVVPEHLDERARMFRARLAGRRVLVVLDNASSEAQVRPMQPGSPGCAVLVTSRTRMAALAGRAPAALDVMPVEQAVDLLRKVVGPDRVAAEGPAAAEIARLCGCLPLALWVAGARLASRPLWRLEWFAARLGDEHRRLDLLKVGDLEVRASFALSYEGRDELEQRAFRMLGLLQAPDFPAWMPAALLDPGLEAAEEAREGRVDAQFIEPAGFDGVDQPRYRFHDLLRDFARECLDESEPV